MWTRSGSFGGNALEARAFFIGPGLSSGVLRRLPLEATGGKATAAMALMAKATASPITVYGTGACSVRGAYLEDWSYGVIH